MDILDKVIRNKDRRDTEINVNNITEKGLFHVYGKVNWI
jgi:hypothetical protein